MEAVVWTRSVLLLRAVPVYRDGLDKTVWQVQICKYHYKCARNFSRKVCKKSVFIDVKKFLIKHILGGIIMFTTKLVLLSLWWVQAFFKNQQNWQANKHTQGKTIRNFNVVQQLTNAYFVLVAICTGGCGVNMNCTAPENCTCVQGWTGQDCLTGIK